MTTTNAAEQSGASRGGLLARHPPRRDDHPRHPLKNYLCRSLGLACV
jgi:hypothetical protein